MAELSFLMSQVMENASILFTEQFNNTPPLLATTVKRDNITGTTLFGAHVVGYDCEGEPKVLVSSGPQPTMFNTVHELWMTTAVKMADILPQNMVAFCDKSDWDDMRRERETTERQYEDMQDDACQ